MTEPFLVGAQYYRPPNPPKADWRRDLAAMKAAGFTMVKYWACWSWMNPEEGRYDFADLDELMDLAATTGLGVVINVILEDAPYWLERKHPDARYVDAEGRAIHLSAAMNTPGGGWPGLCFDNPPVLDAGLAFLAAIVERYREHPALLMWDVWNEPHLEPASYFPDRIYCYCHASVARFRGWMKDRDGTIDAVNDRWARRYSDWPEVEPPRLYEAIPDMLDWRAFWFANLRRWLDARVDTARRAGATQRVTTHVALSGFTGQLATHTLDEWTLGDAVDGFGTSSFPTWLMRDDPVEHLFNLDTARSAARGRVFWQTELQGGRGRRDGDRSTRHPRPSVVALEMWNALAAGASGVLFWQWRPELLGPESPGYGLCAVDGTPTARVEAASAFAKMIARVPELGQTTPLPAAAALLVSRRTALHAYATDRTMDIYRRSVLGAYRLLVDADIALDVIHEDDVEREGVPAHIATIFHPMPAVVGERLADHLARWTETGGRLVSEAAPGEYDDRGWHRATVPPPRLRSLFGSRTHETDAVPDDLPFTLGDGRAVGAWMRDILDIEAAEVIGTFDDGAPAATRQSAGTGEAILLASCPSVSYDRLRDAPTRAAIAALIGRDHGGLARTIDATPGLITRRHRLRDGRAAVFVLNWTGHEQAIALSRAAALHTITSSVGIRPQGVATILPMTGAVLVADEH